MSKEALLREWDELHHGFQHARSLQADVKAHFVMPFEFANGQVAVHLQDPIKTPLPHSVIESTLAHMRAEIEKLP